MLVYRCVKRPILLWVFGLQVEFILYHFWPNATWVIVIWHIVAAQSANAFSNKNEPSYIIHLVLVFLLLSVEKMCQSKMGRRLLHFWPFCIPGKGRSPQSCFNQVFNSKLGSFGVLHNKCMAATRPLLHLVTRLRFSPAAYAINSIFWCLFDYCKNIKFYLIKVSNMLFSWRNIPILQGLLMAACWHGSQHA